MKIIQNEFIFDYDWSSVVRAIFNRYPNPINPSIIACDVIERRLDNENRLYSHRLLTADWDFAPKLKRFFAMINFGYASEHSMIDSKHQRMITRTRNLILSRFINIEEQLELTVLPSDQRKTLLRQELTINVKNIPLRNYFEMLISETMNQNSIKDRQAIEWSIHRMRIPTVSLN